MSRYPRRSTSCREAEPDNERAHGQTYRQPKIRAHAELQARAINSVLLAQPETGGHVLDRRTDGCLRGASATTCRLDQPSRSGVSHDQGQGANRLAVRSRPEDRRRRACGRELGHCATICSVHRHRPDDLAGGVVRDVEDSGGVRSGAGRVGGVAAVIANWFAQARHADLP
jgi:hypothetical protein